MKKIIFLFAIVASMFLVSCSTVEPNYEGVLMENYGKHGKKDFSLQSGRVWTLAPGTSLYQVPMFEQKGDCPSVKVYAKDGGTYIVDPTYSYSPIRGKGIDILFAYKHLYGDPKQFFDNIEGSILNTRVLNAYREEARSFKTDSLLNNVAKYETQVQARLAKEFVDKYFTLSELTSNLTPPKSMSDAIEARNNQILEASKLTNQKQTRENQIAIDIMNVQAEAKKQIIEAEADLQAARLENQARELRNKSLTPAVLEEIKLNKWNGEYPSTIVGTGAGIMIGLPK